MFNHAYVIFYKLLSYTHTVYVGLRKLKDLRITRTPIKYLRLVG